MTSSAGTAFELPADAHVGRVALGTDSLDSVLPFYRETLGFAVERDGHRARLVAGEQTLLVLHEDPDAPARGSDTAGLFHVAVRVPERSALADLLGRVQRSDASLTGASDHLVSEALYFRDPDGNGIEVYCDRPREAWSRTDDGGIEIDTLPLDLDELSELGTKQATLPAGADIGHVHLEVTDLVRAEAFYVDTVDLRVQDRYGDEVTFVAAGDYHHHIGLNTWNHRQSPAGETRGLCWFELVLPDAGAVESLRRRIEEAGYLLSDEDGITVVSDPDDIRMRLVVESQR